MVIKTAVKPRGPSLPSKRPFGHIYQFIKTGLQQTGYYDKYDLRRFDPDYLHQKYVGKYTYKPRKRVAGYLGKALWQKKNLPYGKYGKTRLVVNLQFNKYQQCSGYSKGSYCSQ